MERDEGKLMYEELIKRLREVEEMLKVAQFKEAANLIEQAADAIEDLSREYESIAASLIESVELVRKLQSHNWIPVTERLPEDNEAVNVVWVNHNPVFYYQHIKDKPQTSTGVYYRGQWYWWSAVTQDYLAEYGKWEPDLMDSAIEVTHWMPLPEPPKEET